MKSNNTHFNILASFAYTFKNKKFHNALINESVKGNANVMIDSGAFTLFNAKQPREWLTLDNYCKYIEGIEQNIEKYVMLDVIGNDKASKSNYELMLKRGFNPMFVVTMADNDMSYVSDAVKNNKHICVAGGVTTKGDWMSKRFQDVYKQTKGLIHGLGYVTYPKIFQLPLHSVDSSSWNQSAQAYGILSYWDNGIKSTRWLDILQKKKKMPKGLKFALERIKVTPKDFNNIENHKGQYSIGTYLNSVAYTEYQKYCKRLNLKLFLAVANNAQFNILLKVNENNDNLNWKKWRQKHLL